MTVATSRQARPRLLQAAVEVLRNAGVESPRLDAEILLAAVIGTTRLDLLLRPEVPVSPKARRRFAQLVRRRSRHEPVAYLVGVREFLGRTFRVDRRVLVPRPETEVLAGAAISWLRARSPGRRRILDLGTGSGCLAISIALETPGATVVATDVSPDALAVARANVSHMADGLVALRQGDLFEALDGEAPFDLIVSNPPYVALSELVFVDRSVRGFEPRGAWLAGLDPLAFLRRIVEGAPPRLVQDGAIMLEIGSGADALVELARRQERAARVAVLPDLAGRPRVVVVDRASPESAH